MRGKDGAGGSPGDDRRSELVRIAYGQIAAKGFEGLRVREVAAQAGINNATLHHHFLTKEALIQGVGGHLIKEFQVGRAPRREQGEPGPLGELRYEFDDTRYRLLETPELYVVLMVQIKGLTFHVALGKPPRKQVDRLVTQLAAETERRLTS